jgi:hypothetical protein
VAVSILDDLLQQPEASSVRPELDDVVIDRHGVAMLVSSRPGSLDDMVPIVKEMLGSDEALVPARARTLLAKLESGDPSERPLDADQLRSWIRESLGAPAPREEVLACIDVVGVEDSVLPPPSVVESASAVKLEPAPEDVLSVPAPSEPSVPEVAPVLPAFVDDELPTIRPSTAEPMTATADLGEPLPHPDLDETEVAEPLSVFRTSDLVRDATIAEGHHPSVHGDYRDDPLRDETIAASHPPMPVPHATAEQEPPPPRAPIDPNRPIVRHATPFQHRTSVETAPAARRNPMPLTPVGDSLILPAERRGNWGVWLAVLAVVCAALYYYLL